MMLSTMFAGTVPLLHIVGVMPMRPLIRYQHHLLGHLECAYVNKQHVGDTKMGRPR